MKCCMSKVRHKPMRAVPVMPKAEGKCRAKVKEKRPSVSRSKKECVNDP